MLRIQNKLKDYLECTEYINYDDAAVYRKAQELKEISMDELELIRNTYHFVRDEVAHSWDVQDARITISASDVLQERVGICWAKANLLAALLRVNGIPTGICYQRLTLGETPEMGYCIHALNAVYSKELKRWIRLDARGNKQGVCAEMNLEKEKLAFAVRSEYGEIDYKVVHAKPADITIKVLQENTDALEMYLHHLPEEM